MVYYKLLFTLTLMIGSLISISSYSWFSMWIGLEINLLSIIPIISSTSNSFKSESALKYFVVQAMASMILLMSIILMSNINQFIFSKMSLTIMINSTLLTKMGAAPFHFWFPEIMEGLSWNNSIIMLTWQKLAPMILLIYNNFTIFFLTIIIIFNMIISGIMGLNQTSLRKIMAYSSINHMGWMISIILFNNSLWFIYYIIYSLITINMILIFKHLNSLYLKQLFTSMNNNYIKLFFLINFLSLGGLPPFLGFLPKWLTILSLTENNLIFIPTMMTIMTLMTLYMYLRIIFNSLIMSNNEINFIMFYPKLNNTLMTYNYLIIMSLIFCTMIFNYL
uniref:NADH-ubiquinone oxidoreductase chain 2 n=1 Tax=Glaresis sp. GLA01 TaxID=1205555 RepID=A0A0S2MR65_9SCAR|nr:NADH deshydrogenase subunit 2 [Glaresis sp. GLA01]